jgi:hypothetical protein
VEIDENETAVTTVTATDADAGQTLVYSISGGADADKFSIDAGSGALSFASAPDFETPTDDDGDNVYEVEVQAADCDCTGALTAIQAITVTVADVNDPPVITSDGGGESASVLVDENQTAVTDVDATDADVPAQTLTYSISGGADAAAFSINPGTGLVTFSTAPDFEAPTDAGANNVYNVEVTVTDGTLSDAQNIAVTVANVNEAPSISGTPATKAVQDTAYSFTPTAADPDADSLTFSISTTPSWASFDTATGALTGTPTSTDVGTTTAGIVISVSDGVAPPVSLPAFDLSVSAGNVAPTISGTPSTTVVEGTSYSFVPTASDADNDALTFTITNQPAWASFDTATGALTGTATTVGTTSGIVISVTDGTDTASLPAFDLTVTALDSNGDGISDGQAVAIGLDPQLTDTDGDGISDADEVGGDPSNPIDTDGDGIIDSLEFAPADPTVLEFVVPAPTASALSLPDLSGQQVSLSGNGSAMTANNNGATGLPLYAESDLAVADSGYGYPFGVYDYSVVASGPTAMVTLALPASVTIPSNAVVRKLGVGDQWRTLDSGVAVIDRDNRTITLTLTDNDGVHDRADAAGIIRDPVGLAVPESTSSGGGGGGGCSLSTASRQSKIDPMLPLLALLGLLYLRRTRRRDAA